MIEALFLSTVRIRTFAGPCRLSNATGFFFEANGVLQLITSRHVVLDEASGHRPDRIEIDLHMDRNDLGRFIGFSIPLYKDTLNVWREAKDDEGLVDVVAIDIDQAALPETAQIAAFRPGHLPAADAHVEIGQTLLAIGYPLGFQDTLHHLPLARHASLASSYGLRFGGKGYFLIDARTHRGLSGAPVVMRDRNPPPDTSMPWYLLGVHSSRLEAFSRDPDHDEVLGLNAVWYSDVLHTLQAE
ncbi:MAG: trypsin-like peptidase domain-containing protein [Alphaproteobacteria bacterium]